MPRFSMFSDKELDAMEEAFCIAGLLRLDEEIRKEKNNRIREEAIKTLKENDYTMWTHSSQDIDFCDIRSCDNKDAIKALKQGSILDKIRNEIEELADSLCCDSLYGDGLRHAIDIIDKYKTESEG